MNVHIGVGKAAICISHRMPVPAFRIAVFTHGRIAEYGSYAEWMAQIDTDAMCFSIQVKGACGIICSLLNWKPDERRKRCSIRK